MQARIDVNDDLAVMIDNILNRQGIKILYNRGDIKTWIDFVGDQNLRDGLNELPEIEQQIIEKFFLQRKSLIDIAYELGITENMLQEHINTIKIRLESYD